MFNRSFRRPAPAAPAPPGRGGAAPAPEDDHLTMAELAELAEDRLGPAAAGRVRAHLKVCRGKVCSRRAVRLPPHADPLPAFPGYTLLPCGQPLAWGGMGEVFAATEDVFAEPGPAGPRPPAGDDAGRNGAREVAIKVLNRLKQPDPELTPEAKAQWRADRRARFEAEARLLGRMRHAGIPPVYRIGWLGEGQDDPYLVMRLIPWPDLSEVLDADWKDGPPGPDRMKQYFIWFGRACEAVGYAHDRGVVHRDLKPANVKVDEGGEVQVLDWGLAQRYAGAGGDAGETVVAPPSSSDPELRRGEGTRAYMPPEQALGKLPDGEVVKPELWPAMDVFALGGVLCHMLTGHPPYRGTAGLEDAEARLGRVPRRYREFARLALDCLAVRPQDRLRRVTGGARCATARDVAAEGRRIILSAEDRVRRLRAVLSVGVAALAVAAAAGFYFYGQARAERAERAEAELARAAADTARLQAAADLAEAASAKDRAEAATAKAEAELARAQADRVQADLARGKAEDVVRKALGLARAAALKAGRGDFAHPNDREEMEQAWAEAAGHLGTAKEAATAKATIGPELRADVDRAEQEVDAGAKAFAAARALADNLDKARVRKVYYPDPDPTVRFSGQYFYSQGAAADVEKAFEVAGLDPGYRPDQQAEFLKTVRRKFPQARRVVVAALDELYLLSRKPEAKYLLDLADALDDDPDRKAVRAHVPGGYDAVRAALRFDPVVPPAADPWGRAAGHHAGRALGWAGLGLEARLTPGAALLAAAALEEPGWAGARTPPTRWVTRARLEEAVGLLTRVAERGVRGADQYWLNLTLGFYLWNLHGPDDVRRALAHLSKAERAARVPLPVRVAPDDRAAAAVLRAAAGGLRAHAQAGRASPAEVEEVLKAGADEYPGYWPALQLAVLVKLDRGDLPAARRVVAEWKKDHRFSALAKGYEAFLDALAAPTPAAAAEARDRLRTLAESEEARNEHDRFHLGELLAELGPAPRPEAAAPAAVLVAAKHPNRPGRHFVLVVDARARLDRALDPCPGPARPGHPAAAVAFRPWACDPAGGRVIGRAFGEAWATPDEAADGYDRAAAEAPWATAPLFGGVRRLLAAGQLVPAADEADKHRKLAEAQAGPRPQLYHLFRARLHLFAATDAAGDPGKAQAHRQRAEDVLAQFRGDPRFAPLAELARGEAAGMEFLVADLAAAGRESALEMCDRADVAFRAHGPGWLTARLAAHPFDAHAAFAAAPFAAPGPGREVVVARCLVLAAWGCPVPSAGPGPGLACPAVPPAVAFAAERRIVLLKRLREWLAATDAAGNVRLLKAVFDDPVVRAFAAGLDEEADFPTTTGLVREDREKWREERRAWLALLRKLRPLGVLPPDAGAARAGG